jgi:hypothetical protein
MKYSPFLNRIYSIVSPYRATIQRFEELNRLIESGLLNRMGTSEVHAHFGITREANIP